MNNKDHNKEVSDKILDLIKQLKPNEGEFTLFIHQMTDKFRISCPEHHNEADLSQAIVAILNNNNVYSMGILVAVANWIQVYKGADKQWESIQKQIREGLAKQRNSN